MRYLSAASRLFLALPCIVPVLCFNEAQSQTLPVQSVEVAKVEAKKVEQNIMLPGELQPFQAVKLHARVSGFVSEVRVDRGSKVKKGQLLVKLTAPEIASQMAEAESKWRSAQAQQAQAAAKLAAVQSVYGQLKAASATPGAISGRELIQAQKEVEATQALADSLQSVVGAANAFLNAAKQMNQYLNVTAPFDGVITERMVHPGALVGPTGTGVLLELAQLSKLRLAVSVPEADFACIVPGAKVKFTVPAYKNRKFEGKLTRLSQAIDPRTRSMMVELDVDNASKALAPGMYPEVSWPLCRPDKSLFVPPGSVVTTTEKTFVIRVKNAKAEWVNVKKGKVSDGLVEVTGNLQPGETILQRGNDEIREGTPIQIKAKEPKKS